MDVFVVSVFLSSQAMWWTEPPAIGGRCEGCWIVGWDKLSAVPPVVFGCAALGGTALQACPTLRPGWRSHMKPPTGANCPFHVEPVDYRRGRRGQRYR